MRTFIVFLFLAFLSACSLPGTQVESADSLTTLFEGTGFTTLVPTQWDRSDASILPLPTRGNIVLATMSKDVRYGFSNNYLIMRDELRTPLTSKKYSELNYIQTTRNYLEYTKLQELPIAFSDTDTSLLYVFEARYNKTTPRMKFIQTAKVCGTNVYLLHIALSLDKAPEKYIELMKSFQCK